MRSRTNLSALAAGALALVLAAPALASPRPPTSRPALPGADDETRPRRGAESELPVDGRPVVAMVVEVDPEAGRVTLSTPHGPVSLSVTPDVAERLSPGDVVVVRFTESDDDVPSASPREEPARDGGNRI
jgi:hypothetical protein